MPFLKKVYRSVLFRLQIVLLKFRPSHKIEKGEIKSWREEGGKSRYRGRGKRVSSRRGRERRRARMSQGRNRLEERGHLLMTLPLYLSAVFGGRRGRGFQLLGE